MLNGSSRYYYSPDYYGKSMNGNAMKMYTFEVAKNANKIEIKKQ